MADSDTSGKSRLVRRIFKPRDKSKDRSSINEGLQIPAKPKDGGIACSPPSTVDGAGKSVEEGGTSLWGEVYDTVISTATPELQAIAKRLRDQSIPAKPLLTGSHGRSASVSPEWQLCNEILRMAESGQRSAKKGEETTLMQRVQRAYSGIVAWTQKFVALGDVVAQVDPVHIGLPWAAIRAVLIVCGLQSIRADMAAHPRYREDC